MESQEKRYAERKENHRYICELYSILTLSSINLVDICRYFHNENVV